MSEHILKDKVRVAAVAVHTNPFAVNSALRPLSELQWLDEIIAQVPDLPDRFHDAGVVTVEQGGRMRLIERKYWAKGHLLMRLKFKATEENPVTIHLHMAPGGGGAKGKKIMAIIATIAVIAIATFISAGALGPAGLGLLGPAFAAGGFGAQAGALATSFFGRLLITMLLTPAAKPKEEDKGPELGQAGASGNVIEPGGIFYRVAGERRMFPQLANMPLVELVGTDEIVEATYRLTGPHSIKDIEVEDTPAAQVTGLNIMIDEGLSPNPTRLINRYGFQTTPQKELDAHRRNPTNVTRLEDQTNPEKCLPKPWVITTQLDPDEIWLHFMWPGGVGDTTDDEFVLFPFRFTLEAVGAVSPIKINLPEVMFSIKQLTKLARMVVLTWDDPLPYGTGGVGLGPADDQRFGGNLYAFHTVPVQNVTPVGVGGWTTHASFGNGASPWNNTSRVKFSDDRITIYLDPAVFPRGYRWRVSILRGCITRKNAYAETNDTFVPSTYMPGGGHTEIYSLFDYYTVGGIHYTANANKYYTKNVVEGCILMRAASVWKKTPNPKSGDAVIEVRGINVSVTQLSALAGGLVPTWDGTSFDKLGVSKNPADHYRDVLSGPFTQDPVPQRLINDPALAAWHADNVTNDREVSLVMDGRLWRETLDAIAGAGLAKRSESRRFSVNRTRDTHALGIVPRQVFSHLNMLNFRWDKDLAAVPDAIRVRYPSRDNRWQNQYVLIKRPGLTDEEVKTIIGMDAIGMDREAQVEEFFKIYLAGTWYRSCTFTFDTWFEGLAAEEGDIIGLNHLKLARQHRAHRIGVVTRNGSNEVVSVDLDLQQEDNDEAGLETITDLNALVDMQLQGLALAGTVLTGPGVVTHPLQPIIRGSVSVVFDTPFVNDDVKPGQMMLIGEPALTYQRCEVIARRPAGEMTHTIVCVPEAPEMWNP